MKLNLLQLPLKTFTTKRLSNLRKYGEFKFNFKNFINEMPMHLSNINNRKVDADAHLVSNLYEEYTSKVNDINLMRRQLNTMKQNASDLKKKNIDINNLMKDVKKHTDDIAKFQEQLGEIEFKLMNEALRIPNITHPDVPVGSEENAKLIKLVGKKRIIFKYFNL
jgi:seryl-tRNA synthetase